VNPFFQQTQLPEAGCDEAGRGCLAGPVVAAAVILPPDFDLPKLNDSKQISETVRNELRVQICEQAVAWAIGIADHHEIDQINILKASILAMHRALEQLSTEPAFIIVDGNRFIPFRTIPHRCIVHGDALYASIAAASVLAKTHRDSLMQELHAQYPYYGWDQNKGYPTAIHRRGIIEHGPSPLHRKSFRLLKPDDPSLFNV
jgi:ribonuclease HII